MRPTLDELFDALDPVHDELDALEKHLDKAETAHEIASARAALTAKGSNEMIRKAEVTLNVESEAWEARVANQRVRSAQRKMRILERKIDIQRTREANARTIR